MKIKGFAIMRKSKNGKHKLLFKPNGTLRFYMSAKDAFAEIDRLAWLRQGEPRIAPATIDIGLPLLPVVEK